MATEDDFDRWIEITKECKYLPENELKVLYIVNDSRVITVYLYYSVYFRSFCAIMYVTCYWKSVTYSPCLLRSPCAVIYMDK